jgi:hypothetical protein
VRWAGTQFDAAVVDAFLEVLRREGEEDAPAVPVTGRDTMGAPAGPVAP